MTSIYLSAAEVAERIGVVRSAISRYKMPEPDALIGQTRGWLPETIDEWNANRPGRGARTDLRGPIDTMPTRKERS
ncbi:MAG: XRE family transcriptional regulator [Gordonia sp. (in: high G+C Gram-positive bacteria)]|uniref:helix-turn-helix transcriptional regulator n=1 Tax=Gordonia sp. (in: high G+C Gram-positive bacteria) TaxID=84139 RepID=UPI0039E2834D